MTKPISTLAKVRFIADSIDMSFRGSNPKEQAQIEMIRKEYAPYLYDPNPPAEIIEILGPTADKLIADFISGDWLDMVIRMYE